MVLSTLLLYVAVYAIVFSMGIYYINRLIAKGPIVGEDGAIKKGVPNRPMSAASEG
jgi:cytochrome d ubiquinol oxidase subunit I